MSCEWSRLRSSWRTCLLLLAAGSSIRSRTRRLLVALKTRGIELGVPDYQADQALHPAGGAAQQAPHR